MSKEGVVYDDFNISFSLIGTPRKELKDAIIKKFLNEECGYWRDDIKHVTRYKYFVETLKDGRKVFLLRPTFLNKGIDFQVWVERMDGSQDKRPSHKDVFEDLKIKKKEKPRDCSLLKQAIGRVWNCEEPDEVLKNIKLDYKNGFSTELLLKILKWLFIEQDITYWNYEGRLMLKKGIDKELCN
jgi:hypothetical protein